MQLIICNAWPVQFIAGWAPSNFISNNNNNTFGFFSQKMVRSQPVTFIVA